MNVNRAARNGGSTSEASIVNGAGIETTSNIALTCHGDKVAASCDATSFGKRLHLH
jgi:hypothetical protein